QAALKGPAREWVRARTHLALGKIADLRGTRELAREQYALASRLAETRRDRATLDEAGRLLRTPYRRPLSLADPSLASPRLRSPCPLMSAPAPGVHGFPLDFRACSG